MKKVVITGGSGMLFSALGALEDQKYEFIPLGHQEIEVTDPHSVKDVLENLKPDLVIHAAALTDLDFCEENQAKAFKVNTFGTEVMASESASRKIDLLYISTDAVFDGQKTSPYNEDDLPNPLSIYGKSKLSAEKSVARICRRYFIFRLGWLFSRRKDKKFTGKIRKLLLERDEVMVVDDRFGSPTYNLDAIERILTIYERDICGIYHVANRGCCSRYEFAQEVARTIGSHAKITPVKTEFFGEKAPRPSFSCLECLRARSLGLPRLRRWQEALRECLT